MVSGRKFLDLNKQAQIRFTVHALKRLSERTRVWPELVEVLELFENAQQIKYEDLLNLGYRPNYRGRKDQGQQSWYFQFKHCGIEFVAVIATGRDDEKEMTWVTTYSPSAQTEHYRVPVIQEDRR